MLSGAKIISIPTIKPTPWPPRSLLKAIGRLHNGKVPLRDLIVRLCWYKTCITSLKRTSKRCSYDYIRTLHLFSISQKYLVTKKCNSNFTDVSNPMEAHGLLVRTAVSRSRDHWLESQTGQCVCVYERKSTKVPPGSGRRWRQTPLRPT